MFSEFSALRSKRSLTGSILFALAFLFIWSRTDQVSAVSPSMTVTTAANVNSAATLVIPLSATVTSGSIVNEGVVSFSVYADSGLTTQIGSTIGGTVTNGVASAYFPPITSFGGYYVKAAYHDSLSMFADSIDTSHTLSIFARANSTITVGTASDAAPNANCFTTCALRTAIEYASADDTIQFNTALNGSVIRLSNGILSLPGVSGNPTPVANGSSGLTITGPGATLLKVSANNSGRVFYINVGITVTFASINIADGNYSATIKGGAGIYNAGTLTLNNVTVFGNTLQGSYGNDGGGGIENEGTLNLVNSTVTGNSSLSAPGAGIFNDGTLNLTNSIVSSNVLPGYIGGSGIYSIAGTLTISNSTISNNTASQGTGIGIFVQGTTVTINNSTISANSAATGYDAGIHIGNTATMTITGSTIINNSSGYGGGGGIGNSGILTVTNSTIAGNSTTFGGGGIDNSGVMTVNNSTVYNNKSIYGGINNNIGYHMNLLSNVLSANTPSDLTNTGILNSLGYNVIAKTTISNGFIVSDQVNVDPLLLPLGNYGGLLQTVLIPVGSPAYEHGYCGGNTFNTPIAPAVSVDNRTVSRKAANPGCDAGAFEELFTFTPSLANLTVGDPYSQTISGLDIISAGSNFAVSSGALPPGLTLAASGVLTGIPTSAGTFTFTVTAQDTSSFWGGVSYSLVVSLPVPARIDTIGIYRGGTFYLRLHNNTGNADIAAAFTAGTKPLPVVGDWTGAGFDSIGVYDQNTGIFSLRNSITAGSPDETFVLGNPNDTPLSGRWSIGATHAGAGVYRPSNGILYVRAALTTGFADHAEVLGNPGDEGIAGDWTGKGYDSPGVYRPSAITFYLSNQVTDGVISADLTALYGNPTDVPIAGDWIAQGHDGIGMFRPSNGIVYLKNQVANGYSDINFIYGIAGDAPIAGHWQAVYPPSAPIVPAPVLIAKTATPRLTATAVSVPGGNGIGG